jgi:hypothetical protein
MMKSWTTSTPISIQRRPLRPYIFCIATILKRLSYAIFDSRYIGSDLWMTWPVIIADHKVKLCVWVLIEVLINIHLVGNLFLLFVPCKNLTFQFSL